MSYRPTSDTQTRAVTAVCRAYSQAGLPPLLAAFVSLSELLCLPPWSDS